MSWSINIPQVDRTTAGEAVLAAKPSGQDELPDERDQQVHVAKMAVLSFIDSDGLFSGDPGDSFSVSVYGHANPGHKNRQGWSNDTITVTVSRRG